MKTYGIDRLLPCISCVSSDDQHFLFYVLSCIDIRSKSFEKTIERNLMGHVQDKIELIKCISSEREHVTRILILF